MDNKLAHGEIGKALVYNETELKIVRMEVVAI